jgi:hypothetical protein
MPVSRGEMTGSREETWLNVAFTARSATERRDGPAAVRVRSGAPAGGPLGTFRSRRKEQKRKEQRLAGSGRRALAALNLRPP